MNSTTSARSDIQERTSKSGPRSKAETALELRMSLAHLTREMQAGRITFKRAGLRKVLFTQDDIEQYLTSRDGQG